LIFGTAYPRNCGGSFRLERSDIFDDDGGGGGDDKLECLRHWADDAAVVMEIRRIGGLGVGLKFASVLFCGAVFVGLEGAGLKRY